MFPKQLESRLTFGLLPFLVLTAFSCSRQVSTEISETELKRTTVARVIDGDTIKMQDSSVVRYIGIDTPERGVYFYKEAKAVNDSLVDDKRVELKSDKSEKDRFGRFLHYVFVDTLFVNAWLIQWGYAEVMTIPPDTIVCFSVSTIRKRS